MLPLELIVTTLLVLAMCLTVLALNTGILAVNLNDWKKSRNLHLSDRLHIATGLVNILLQCALGVQITLYFVSVSLIYNDYWFKAFAVLVTFLVYFNIWLNAWLCVHYVTSIATFTYPFFVWVKGNISVIMPKLILVSAVGSFSISAPYIWISHVEVKPKSHGNKTFNSTGIQTGVYVNSEYQLIAATLGCFFPFMISNLCLGHTLASLWRHVRRITHTDSGLSPPNLQAHVRAARTMTLLLLLYLSYYVAQVVSLVFTFSNIVATALSGCLILLFPAAHAFIMIQASSKLRKVLHPMGCVGRERSGKSDIKRNG